MNLPLLNHPDSPKVLVTVGSLEYLDGLGSALVTVIGPEKEHGRWSLVLNDDLVLRQG